MENHVGEMVGLVSLGIVVLGHLCTTVWWMSKITTTLEIMSKSVDSISAVIIKHEATYYNKEDAMREIGKLEQKIDKAHIRIDNFHENCIECQKMIKNVK